MSDDRTERQRAADEALEAAIHECSEAYRTVPSGSVTTTWLVVGTAFGLLDGEESTINFKLLPNGGGGSSWPILIGLLRCAAIDIEQAYAREMELGE